LRKLSHCGKLGGSAPIVCRVSHAEALYVATTHAGKARTVGHLRFLAELFTAKPHALIDARTVHAYLSILFARCAVHRVQHNTACCSIAMLYFA
jgi:hypothetical protein